MAIKVIKESTVNVAKLKFNSNSDIERAFDELFDLTYNGIEVRPVRDDVPAPWDADLSMSNGKIIVRGGVTPNGTGEGVCTLTLPVDTDAYIFSIDFEDENQAEIMNLLKDCNIDLI